MARLIDEKTGAEIVLPSVATTYRGQVVTVVGFTIPRHAGSSGRVQVRHEMETWTAEYYPSVIGAVIVDYE